MKKRILLAVVVLLAAAASANAEEGKLSGTIDVTYVSSYIWRGFDVYGPGGHSAIQPSINVDLYGTGFGTKVWMSRANSSGYEDGERWDYTLYYYNKLFDDEAYATNYTVSWVYYSYPDSSKHTYDLQEANLILSWPKIFPGGLVPGYILIHLWPSSSNSNVSQAVGWAHIFTLDYPWAVPGFMPDTIKQILNLHAELVYNDGADPRANGTGVDHDWSNAVFGVSTDFSITKDLSFTPGLYYQVSMDDSVNDDDETWVSMSMKYKF